MSTPSGNHMRDCAARGDGDPGFPADSDAERELRIDRVLEQVARQGRNADLIVSLVEDEVMSQHLVDLSLDIVLARRSGDHAAEENASAVFERWLAIQAAHWVDGGAP